MNEGVSIHVIIPAKTSNFSMKNALFWPLEPNFSHKLCPISVRNCKLRIIAWRGIQNFSILNTPHFLHSLPFPAHSVRSAPISPFSNPSHLKQADCRFKIDIFSFRPFPYFLFFRTFIHLFKPFLRNKKDPKHFPCLESSFFFSRFMRFFPGHYAGFVREINIHLSLSSVFSSSIKVLISLNCR